MKSETDAPESLKSTQGPTKSSASDGNSSDKSGGGKADGDGSARTGGKRSEAKRSGKSRPPSRGSNKNKNKNKNKKTRKKGSPGDRSVGENKAEKRAEKKETAEAQSEASPSKGSGSKGAASKGAVSKSKRGATPEKSKAGHESGRDDSAPKSSRKTGSKKKKRAKTSTAKRSNRKKTAKSTAGAKAREKSRSKAAGATSGSGAETRVHKRILIDMVDPEELRIAVLESGRLEEISVEIPENKAFVGNIYKGRIVNLEPAIQAAFVDIGIGRNAFLHVSDVLPVYSGAKAIPFDSLSKRPSERKRLKIQDILEKGQEILVQISKDSIGAKGPSLTTYISVPGKYLVLMPGVLRYGVSKRIQDREIRSKLRDTLSKLNPPKGLGYIIRTASKENPEGDLVRDFNHLMGVWDTIRERVGSNNTPALLFEEADLLARALRDICGPDVEEVVVNDEAAYQRARDVLKEVMPTADIKVKHYSGHLPLFSKFGIEDEIEKIYNRRIALASGGYLIIEQTEALVAIDVNSGKYTDEDDLEDTALKTNLEAAVEIARQLRLRDLGGVVVNDFIDMMDPENRREVEKAFRMALKRDRAKCWVSKISRFGIVEMTRQRMRPSLERSIFEPCKHCRGTGRVKSLTTAATAVLRQLRVGLATRRKKRVEVLAHPDLQTHLLNQKRRQILALEEMFKKDILILGDSGQEPDQVQIRFV